MKLTKNIKILFALVIPLSWGIDVSAQDVNLTASAPRVVEVGEQFRISYTLNAKGNDFQDPDFGSFKVLSGPNVSTSSSVQIVNGSMSQSVTYAFNYILLATTAGNVTIGEAQIKAGGKIVKSEPIRIEVVQGNQQQHAESQQTATSSTPETSSNNSGLFVSVNVDKKSLYQGESLVAEIMVYTQKSLAGFEDIKFPPFTGFWSQDLESPQQIQLHRENVNGQIYEVGLFKKLLLFPQRSGEIVIDPFEITMITQDKVKSNNPFDDFFGGSYRRVPYKLASKPITIKVNPLPQNAPASFNGAVGNLSMDVKVDKYKVKANEAVNLNVKISGTGNLKLIKALKIDFPPDIDVYDPKTSVNTNVTNNGITGNISFEYLFIPRFSGTYRIAPVSFSYFDTQTKTYKTITSKEFVIEVERGSGDEELTSGIVQGLTKEDVKFIGEDIRFLKSGFVLAKKTKPLYNSVLFYGLYSIGALIFMIILIGRRTQIKQNANQAKVKNRKANRVSFKRLKKAAEFMRQNATDKFYDELLKAIWGYLSDKLVIPVSNLSKDNVSEILEKRNVDKELVDELMELLNTAEFARYAPASVSGGMEDLYKKSVSLVSRLDQKIK